MWERFMTFRANSDIVRRRLIKESNGSFYIVNKALNQLRAEQETRHLDIDDVIRRIHKLQAKEEVSAKEKIPA
jgi:hypothetical protein